jgi:hypothetical protein
MPISLTEEVGEAGAVRVLVGAWCAYCEEAGV